ncbi:arrestin [Xylariaceae sp. AK1471]|nr:arrestin [Xylariaceae sp. AK1471]
MMNRSWPNTRASTIVEPTRKHTIPKTIMNVYIDNHYQSKIYTTSSNVSGHVKVNTSHDVQFDTLQVLLLGTSKTSIDAVSIPQATSHTFLKLTMPIPDSYYPIPRRFEAGCTYTIPFHFVIPQHLTLNACSHCVPNNALKDHHLRLPPSVGNWDKDDCAPRMARVTYSVRARVYHEEVDGKTAKVMEASHDIKVLPTVAEDPPLSIARQDRMYVLSKSKTLRKSILSPKLGTVTVSANQPAPAMMSSDGHRITPTTAQLDLVFEPTSCESQPPKITAVTSKVTAVTYYSTGGINQYPNLKDWSRSFGADGRGVYTNSIPLPSTPVEKAEWKQHLTAQARRDSGYGSELHSDSDHSADGHQTPPRGSDSRKRNKGAPYYYTTKVQVPVQLPTTKKQFIPTFHSCITSRVYVLWMTVTLSALTGSSSTVTLGVPLQVGVSPREGSRVDSTGLPNFEAAMEDAALEVDAFFQPRTMSVPDVEFHSELPGYSELSGRIASRA